MRKYVERVIFKIMIWYTNESGYTCSLDVPEVEKCRMCGKEFKRSLQIMPYSGIDFRDECPNCKHTFNIFRDLKLNNVLQEA